MACEVDLAGIGRLAGVGDPRRPSTVEDVIFDEDEEPEGDDPPPPKPRAGPGASVIAAAMLGLGEVLEPEKTKVDIEEQSEADDQDDLLIDLHFGDLPPINPN